MVALENLIHVSKQLTYQNVAGNFYEKSQSVINLAYSCLRLL